jgi:hypothetical protein
MMPHIVNERIIKYRKLSVLAHKLEEESPEDAKLIKAVMSDIFLDLIRAGVRPLDIFGLPS